MSGEVDVAFVTDDAVLIRASRKLAPARLDPDDEALIAGKAVMNSEEMLRRVEAEMRAEPERHPPLPEHRDLPDGVTLTVAEIRRLSKMGNETASDYVAAFRPIMTDELAVLIRGLRVEEGFSWRAVARWVHGSPFPERWPGEPSNQLAGMALCALAAERLGEDCREPPWNEFPPEDDS